MPILQWKEKFTLGIEQFDRHHMHLVELLNSAYDDFLSDSCVVTLTATLNEFFEYALYHFRVEEKYMEGSNNSGYLEHLELHRSFSAQIAVMQKDLRKVQGDLPLEMLSFLNNWLTYEILVADAGFVRLNSVNQWRRCA